MCRCLFCVFCQVVFFIVLDQEYGLTCGQKYLLCLISDLCVWELIFTAVILRRTFPTAPVIATTGTFWFSVLPFLSVHSLLPSNLCQFLLLNVFVLLSPPPPSLRPLFHTIYNCRFSQNSVRVSEVFIFMRENINPRPLSHFIWLVTANIMQSFKIVAHGSVWM